MALGIQLEKEGISVSVVAKTVPELLLFFRNEEAPRLRLPFSKDRRLGEGYTLTVSFGGISRRCVKERGVSV